MTQSYVFTPVVQGLSQDTLECSVHIAIWLEPDAGEASLKDFKVIRDWGSQKIDYSLAINGKTVPAQLVPQASPPSHPAAAWLDFFPPGTPVRTAGDPPSLDKNHMVWFNTAIVANAARNHYKGWGKNTVRQSTGGAPSMPAPPALSTQESQEFQNAREFFRPLGSHPRLPVTRPPDFHDLMAFLHDVPPVLRALGLIVDLRIDLKAAGIAMPLGPGPDPAFTVCVVPAPHFQDPGISIHTPTVKLHVSQACRQIEPMNNYYVVEFDVMHAALQLSNQSRFPSAGRLPALRTGGLSLIHNPDNTGQCFAVSQMINKVAAAARGRIPEQLVMDDLTLGRRVDVRDSLSGAWHSLCRIVGQATRGNSSIPIDGEGFISSALAKKTDGAIRGSDVWRDGPDGACVRRVRMGSAGSWGRPPRALPSCVRRLLRVCLYCGSAASTHFACAPSILPAAPHPRPRIRTAEFRIQTCRAPPSFGWNPCRRHTWSSLSSRTG